MQAQPTKHPGYDAFTSTGTAGLASEIPAASLAAGPLRGESIAFLQSLQASDFQQAAVAGGAARKLAKDCKLYDFARVLRGLELFAVFMAETGGRVTTSDRELVCQSSDLAMRMLEKIEDVGNDSTCDSETTETKCLLLQRCPQVASLAAKYPA